MQVDGAIQVFNRCRRKGHKFEIGTFNSILHGLAAKKRVLDFQVFFHNMTADNVPANIQTYAAMLELYGQQKNVNMIKEACEKIESLVSKNAELNVAQPKQSFSCHFNWFFLFFLHFNFFKNTIF